MANNDKVIKPHHSEDLYAKAVKCGKEDLCDISIRADMDHNNFSFMVDIAEPIKRFIKKKKLFTDEKKEYPEDIRFCKLSEFKDIGKAPFEYNGEKLKNEYLEKNNKSCCTIF